MNSLSIRRKNTPKKCRVGWVRIRVRKYFINNIIIHSVNNILILLSMINSVNVKKTRYVVCVFAICCDFAKYLLFIIFYVNTVYH